MSAAFDRDALLDAFDRIGQRRLRPERGYRSRSMAGRR